MNDAATSNPYQSPGMVCDGKPSIRPRLPGMLVMSGLGLVLGGFTMFLSAVAGGLLICLLIALGEWSLLQFHSDRILWEGFVQNAQWTIEYSAPFTILGAFFGTFIGLLAGRHRSHGRWRFIVFVAATFAAIGVLAGLVAENNIRSHFVSIDTGQASEVVPAVVYILLCVATGAACGWALAAILLRLRQIPLIRSLIESRASKVVAQ